ncbi:DgyrCDS14042 [Dimorphilus gyrociliatus]|uniref:DgyrCDS14042 n=1 Tax=Dimorphilus gyrociliatus TaxID=2664684 RepID=A0A7I8WCR0_9ANNE|nr:DgyrCDS14042 [Dimorphilus gyrociliatus]
MPRVVPNQKETFENDDLLRRLSRETEIRYTSYRDRQVEDRREKFREGCEKGYTEVVFLKSRFIFNGVCVIWKGSVDLTRLDGSGRLEFDVEKAKIEERLLDEEVSCYRRRLQEFEEKERLYFLQQQQQQQNEEKAKKAEAELRRRQYSFFEAVRPPTVSSLQQTPHFHFELCPPPPPPPPPSHPFLTAPGYHRMKGFFNETNRGKIRELK